MATDCSGKESFVPLAGRQEKLPGEQALTKPDPLREADNFPVDKIHLSFTPQEKSSLMPYPN